MAERRLAARKVFDHSNYNWVFLIWYLVYGFVTLLFLFYFNRVLATTISYGVRLYTWHYYRVSVHIQSLQLSPLAGRIFFKGIRYYGCNETVLIQDGYITWRYWLLRVQEVEHRDAAKQGSCISENDGPLNDTTANFIPEEGGSRAHGLSEQLPCRVVAKVRGVQWFIYNRTPAYDAMMQSMLCPDETAYGVSSTSVSVNDRSGESGSHRLDSEIHHRKKNASDVSGQQGFYGSRKPEGPDTVSIASTTDQDIPNNEVKSHRLPSLLNILPVHVDCGKAAVVMGNHCTKAILVAKIDGAHVQLTARSSSAADLYKQVIDFDFNHPTIHFQPNKDYRGLMFSEGQKICAEDNATLPTNASWYDQPTAVRRATAFLKGLVPYHNISLDGARHARPRSAPQLGTSYECCAYDQNRWLGLTRYLDEEDDTVEQERWRSIEYACVPCIVDCPSISMCYYWDIPGKVSYDFEHSDLRRQTADRNINGQPSPEWGIELRIRGGTLNYGPWADRQRANLQAMFFPALYKDARPAMPLSAGDQRVSTELRVIIIIEDQVTVRIPHREDSKDWKWRGCNAATAPKDAKSTKRTGRGSRKAAGSGQEPESRPFGWTDAKIQVDSTVSFVIDMVAGMGGYRNVIDVDFKGIELASSVNHAVFWRSGSQTISCDLSNPLGWNAVRRWQIDVHDQNLELFILRDHMFLLTDLINDWASGPPSDFHTFVPFEYSLNLHFLDFRLVLNANDSNIIDDPASTENNTFVTLWGEELSTTILVPMRDFRPSKNKVQFDAEARHGGLKLTTASWNTQHTFLESEEVTSLKDLKINGSYTYFTRTSPTLTDVLVLDIYGETLKIQLYGFLIRYFMNIQENYFGDNIHFRTFEEYQSQLLEPTVESHEVKAEQHKRPSNDLDTILTIKAEKCTALLPSLLYSAREGVRFEIFSVAVDLRITNYYMDLAVSSSPISVFSWSGGHEAIDLSGGRSDIQLFVNGLEVFGHRLFGLPPDEPTYVCNWDFEVGQITGECTVIFLRLFVLALRCFGLSFDDKENALTRVVRPVIHDVTFLRACVSSVLVALRMESHALVLSTRTIRVDLNDWAGPMFSDKLHASIPELTLTMTDTKISAPSIDAQEMTARTHAYLKATIAIDKVTRKRHSQRHLELQQDHIGLHDIRTGRVPWLVRTQDHIRSLPLGNIKSKLKPPAMPYPGMPDPIYTHSQARRLSLGRSSRGTSTSSEANSFLLTRSPNLISNSKYLGSWWDIPFEQPVGQRPILRADGDNLKPNKTSLSNAEHQSTSGQKQGSRNPGFVFSSPFKAPHFPLLATIPDMSGVPNMPRDFPFNVTEIDEDRVRDVQSRVLRQEIEHVSIMVDFTQGLQVLCTPETLASLTQVQEQLQAVDAYSLLDSLHLDVMQDLLELEKKRKRGSRSDEILVSIPCLAARFVNFHTVSSDLGIQEQERYDCSLRNASFIVRSISEVSKGDTNMVSSQIATHFLVERLHLSARESPSSSKNEQAIISMELKDLMSWFVQGSRVSAELQIGEFDIRSASRKVNYISSLVHHTGTLAHDLSQRSSNTAGHYKRRLCLFLLLLTRQSSSSADPPFLSGASYVLRSARNHLRNSHSWWMICHLRFILMKINDLDRKNLLAQCDCEWASCAKDTGEQIASYFERLHSWDLGHAKSTLLMHRCFGKRPTSSTAKAQDQVAVKASLNLRHLRVVVEPGPSQNEILVERCIIGLSSAGFSQSNPIAKQKPRWNTISVHSAKIAVGVSWSLCELVENIIETTQSTSYHGQQEQRPTQTTQSKDSSSFHIAASSDISILNIAAVNVKAVTVCRSLKASVVTSTARHGYNHATVNIVVNVDGAKVDLYNHTLLLSEYNLSHARVCASQEISSGCAESKPWNLICSGQKMALQLVRTPVELMEIIDNVIQHEVAHLLTWMHNLPSRTLPTSEQVVNSRPKPLKAHVALLLDSYSIMATILPSLVYEIRGEGVRASIQSAGTKETYVTGNIELKEHAQVFKSRRNGKSSEVAALQIPPIHGLWKVESEPKQSVIHFRVYIEHVKLNASSLHALFEAVNQPATISLGRHLQEEVKLVQGHLGQVFGKKEPQTFATAPSSRVIMFNAHAVVERLTVHAITPEAPASGHATEFKLDLGRIVMQATNSQTRDGSTMSDPELSLQLNSIQIDLLRLIESVHHTCGSLSAGFKFRGASRMNEAGKSVRFFDGKSASLHIRLFTETASAVVSILAHLKETLKTIEIPEGVKDLRKLGRKRLQREGLLPHALHKGLNDTGPSEVGIIYSFIMTDTRIRWSIGDTIPVSPKREPEDLSLSFRNIDLANKQGHGARLLVQDFQLQMAPPSNQALARSLNSALLPEVIFNVAYKTTHRDLRLAFQAVGKTLDLQLTSQSILPANDLRRSIAVAAEQVRIAADRWRISRPVTEVSKPSLLSNRKLISLLVYADFAGAVVHIQGRNVIDPQITALNVLRSGRLHQHGKYNQFVVEESSKSGATLRSPGVALQVQYKANQPDEQSLSAEMKITASSNTLFPVVVPLVMEMSSSIKEIMGEGDQSAGPKGRKESKLPQPKFLEDESFRSGDPNPLLGNCKLNLGLRICQQDFSLSCQPIARVAARARFEDIYFTINTVQSAQYGKFYTMTVAFTGLEASVQHVYSRESSGSVNIESILVSLMNSKHVTAVNGISAIIKVSPVKAQVNAKQIQDFLLFRELWIPPEIRHQAAPQEPSTPVSEPQNYVIQRYQRLAATSAFPWNATLSIAELDVQLDLGSSIGKTRLQISDFWVSSQKSSDWEQNLCIGFQKMAVDITGRMSGLVELQNFKVRTMIKWTMKSEIRTQTPLVQASTGLDQLRVKAGFDFQPFLILDVSSFEFLMYNVRDQEGGDHDRLVTVLEGDKVQTFCTATSASQALSLIQTFQRLMEEKQKAYEASLADIEKFLRRKSTLQLDGLQRASSRQYMPKSEQPRSSLRLHTDVVVSLKAVNVGAFPGTFMDSQIFKLEASDTSARFAVYLESQKIHSTLSMILGQLRVGLSSVDRNTHPKTLGQVGITDVVAAATGSKGGTILKVPRLVATMETWQEFESTHIDYVFKSEFQGKVDVGWNYSRISYIRGMYSNHARTLAQRLGKPLPQSAVQITGLEGEGREVSTEGGQEKITAVVNVPQSKYQYTALQAPVIETPQLRDMGEATPPLEWIGLHRERLPTLTHQVVIVTLLEVAKEVDDAYSKILRSS